MKSTAWRPKLALFWAHPSWMMVIAIVGAAIAIASGRAARLSPTQLSTCVFISLVTGLPAILLTKRLIRRDIGAYADFSLGITLRTMGLRSWTAHWKSILAVMPVLLAFGACAVLARYLGLPYLPMLGMLTVLSLLSYPEQEEVYRALKAKLAEMENRKSGARLKGDRRDEGKG